MTAYDRLPDAVTEIFGADATAERAYGLLTVDVPATSWIEALETARTELTCTYFDWLSAVDEPGTGFRVCAHVVSLEGGTVRRLLLRTTVPHEAPVLPSAITVYAGAGWHERETHEMFGVTFTGHPHLVPLLLPEGFEGHPLRKDFVLAARVVKAWPGAKEPGESEHGGPKRRQMLPPGVPDPNEWGPLKGQLPPAPARPARTPRTPGAADRPARRTRTAGEGSASQATPGAAADRPARRTRTAAEGSASQATPGAAAAPARSPESPQGPDAPPTPPPPPPPAKQEAQAVPADPEATPPSPAPRSPDAPWHHARPAFEESGETTDRSGTPPPGPHPDPDPAPPRTAPDTAPAPDTSAPTTSTAPDTTTAPDAPAPADVSDASDVSDVSDTQATPRPSPGSADGPEADEPTDNAGGDPA
ncbi:NADH-quinone oxidoreductase subunit C [Streptomyces sp. NPDC055078]